MQSLDLKEVEVKQMESHRPIVMVSSSGYGQEELLERI
jgi:hypothetical protein